MAPNGEVIVEVPPECPLAKVKMAVQKRARWIFQNQDSARRSIAHTVPREYISGETHFFLGRRYQLRVKVELGRILGGGEENPVHRVKPAVDAEILQHLTLVTRWIGGDGDELHHGFHWRDVHHLLHLGELFCVKRAEIRAVGIDEMQYHHLALEVGQADCFAIGILQSEVGRFLVLRLEEFVRLDDVLFQFIQAVRKSRRRQRSYQ